MAFIPGPVLDKRIKIHRTRVLQDDGKLGEPGEILSADVSGIVVACAKGALCIQELQPEGKKRMDAKAFLTGHPLPPRARFAAHRTLVTKAES